MRTLTITIGAVAAAVLAVVAGVAVTLVLAVRSGDRARIAPFTRFQRDHVNPAVLRTAGTAGDGHAVIEHIGRRSGRAYETPIGAVRHGDDWFVLLVYGEGASWARNVTTAGDAVLRVDGVRRHVVEATVVPVGETPLAASDPLAIRIMRIRTALRLRDAGPV